ncbi:hypothetical protein HTZ77_27795 [Nonomuraea sp. SMC257]|uniref:Uncharacterized protein n=1 Tax=Nonomuraea montanisoli TaxID=2741721 RepID=A0A7Y6M632_9ACTN|nr:hypothetical protein [Nonomuraea montanisoli]NUW35206.1 hypothetical protein [Nonomuraea montanisoli]
MSTYKHAIAGVVTALALTGGVVAIAAGTMSSASATTPGFQADGGHRNRVKVRITLHNNNVNDNDNRADADAVAVNVERPRPTVTVTTKGPGQ